MSKNLNDILMRSKAVMNKTKDLPYGGYVESKGTTTLEDGSVIFSNDQNSSPMFNESVASKSKLPQEIINAMRNSANESVSVIDSIEMSNSLREDLVRKTPNQQSVTRQQATSTVDYSLIKTIMEDTVKKYIGGLKKTMLAEEKGSGLQLMTKKGNTFRFVTEDGKIFEAQLTYKGNINK